MPIYQRGDVRILYEEVGSDFPLLVIPGGGLNSRVSNWPTAVINAMEAFKNDGKPAFDASTDEAGWEALRLSALASSLMDGLSVWLRETRHPENEQSPGILHHETDRARRLIGLWETEIDCPTMQGNLNLA